MKRINFSYSWNNKLVCNSYTTLRIANANKYQVGSEYEVYLKGARIHNAAIVDIKELSSVMKINEFIAHIDTGYNYNETIEVIRKMYPKLNLETKPFYLILLKVIKS